MTSNMSTLYFGKLRCRGDFVRSPSHSTLIQSLDRWLSASIELMAEDAHWKQIYDQADVAHFAMLGARRTTAVAGHIVPSADTSGRRFPFLTACTVEPESGLEFMSLAPLMLRQVWGELANVTAHAFAASDETANAVLGELNQLEVAAPPPPAEARSQYQRYLEQTSLVALAQDLSEAGTSVDLRQIVLAIGLLLQPLMSGSNQQVEKGICLPLPRDELTRPFVATFWMDLVSRFLTRTGYDLTVFLPRGANHAPGVMIGFSAGSASLLHGIFDSRVTGDVFLTLNESPWVESYIDNDYALKKLSSYLQLPQLSLAQALATFQEAFLGS